MKRTLKYLGLGLLAIFLVLFLIVQFLGGSIGRSVIAGLNDSLNTEITAGDVSVSLLRAFPSLSVDLEDFTMIGSDGTPLIEAERMSCQIGLSSIFGKTRIKTIVVSNGALQIYVDPDGNTNYQLLAYQPLDEQLANQDQTSEAAVFAIDDARLEDIEFVYINEQLGLEAAALLYDANFRGDFGEEIYDMATTANAELRFIDNGDQRLFAGQSLRIGAESVVNNTEQTYNFKELYLGLGGLNLLADGSMKQAIDGWETDLNFRSEESSLTDLLLLLPQEYRDYLGELRSKGKFEMSGTVKERWTEARQPEMAFRINFTDGLLSSPRMDVDARDLNFTGEFTNGRQRLPVSSVFAIENLSGEFAGQPFQLQLQVENFDDPLIVFGAEGEIPGEALPGLLPEGILAEADGEITIENLRIEGRYEDMLSPRTIGKVKTGGRFLVNKVAMEVNEQELELASGDLTLNDNQFKVNDLRLLAEGTDITFTGEATNLIPVLFADSLNTKDARLTFRTLLTGSELDIDELLKLSGPTEEEIEEAEDTGTEDQLARKSLEKRGRLVDLLNGQFDARIDDWNYGKIEGTNFIGQIDFVPRKMTIQGQSDAMEGRFLIGADLVFTESPRLNAKIKAQHVDAEQFFEQGENFGQEVLTSDNLEGWLDSRMYIRAYFSPEMELDYDKLLVLAEVDIRDGELHDFEMLENFGAVLKAKDLGQVRFTNLRNYLEISDQIVQIPVMFIQSSAMNMTLSGSHSFTHVMDYNIKVNAGQVLANKIAKHDDDLKLLPARRNGFFNLYYTVKGNLDNYEVETNKREVKKDFERSELHKNRIRRELENQFKEVIEEVEEPVDWRDEG
ncbi:hypothetical protein CEQ90_07530 [Lewinellaceae bacterium SD302]|nr:hypothetical protein CEQ90_07530 [Lewinellaceae bacterium SD302]